METVEAVCSIAHVASQQEVRDRLQLLPSKALLSRELGILACQRAIKSNPDVGVCRAFLEQPEIRQNVNFVPSENFTGVVPTTLLHAAVLRPTPDGDAIVRLLLALPEVDLNLGFRDGLSPLQLACLLCRYEIVELLLNDRRVHLGAKTLDHRTALHCACSEAPQELGFGNTSWGAKWEVEMGSGKWEVVRILLSAAATSSESLMWFLNERDSHGRTALHYASENNHTAVVGEILDAGLHMVAEASESTENLGFISAVDNRGRMPVHWAAEKGHREVVRLLLSRGPHTLHSKDSEALTPLHHAVRGGHLHILQDWVSQCVPKSVSESLEQQTVKTFIDLLKITSHYEVAEFLLKELDQQLQASSPNATSLLHWAVESRFGYGGLLIPHFLKWKPHLANEILDQERNQTPLHVATISGQLDAVRALCTEQGWSLVANRKDKYNKTALDYAQDLNYKHLSEHLTQRPDVKEYVTKLQKERDAYVAGANGILVVAVLIAGASFASCVKPLDQSPTPSDPSLPPPLKSAPTSPLHLMIQTTFLTSIAATILGACASLPFSFGLYTGSFKPTSRCHSDYIGHKVGRVRVLVALASYFLLSSLASMVFSFLCASEFGVDAAVRSLFACKVFTVTLASVTLLVLATYFGKAHYCKTKQLTWRHKMSVRACFLTQDSLLSRL